MHARISIRKRKECVAVARSAELQGRTFAQDVHPQDEVMTHGLKAVKR